MPAANATVVADVNGWFGRVFQRGDRVVAEPQSATDKRRGWVTLQGERGWPTIVCVPIKLVKLDKLVGPRCRAT